MCMQAVQNLMIAVANAMAPLVPGGPYPYPNPPLGVSAAVTLAPNQGGICVVRVARGAIPMISFGLTSHSPCFVKMPGALGACVAALTAPTSSEALSLASVTIRYASIEALDILIINILHIKILSILI